jgi:hypothetical protein
MADDPKKKKTQAEIDKENAIKLQNAIGTLKQNNAKLDALNKKTTAPVKPAEKKPEPTGVKSGIKGDSREEQKRKMKKLAADAKLARSRMTGKKRKRRGKNRIIPISEYL